LQLAQVLLPHGQVVNQVAGTGAALRRGPFDVGPAGLLVVQHLLAQGLYLLGELLKGGFGGFGFG
jgi:hypothetical protein